MSGTTTKEATPAMSAEDLAQRFQQVEFDSNPLTPIKAEALLELYERQVKAGDPRAVFTLGMIEGFLESQHPDFDIYTATENLSERLGQMILKRFFGSAFSSQGSAEETNGE